MICRNCKFSLRGSEKFCPNCGAPLSEAAEEKKEEAASPPEAPKIFFTPVRQEQESPDSPEIFRSPETYHEAVRESAEKRKSKSNSKAPVVLMLVLVLAVLVMGLFVAAEHFDIAPAIMQYLDGGPAESSTTEPPLIPENITVSDFGKNSGIIKPQISYAPTQAYVANCEHLSLRKGPSDSYGLIKNLVSGCQIQILGGSGLDEMWIYVYIPYHDCYGWLNSSFVTLYNNLETTVPEQTTEETTAQTETAPQTQP